MPKQQETGTEQPQAAQQSPVQAGEQPKQKCCEGEAQKCCEKGQCDEKECCAAQNGSDSQKQAQQTQQS